MWSSPLNLTFPAYLSVIAGVPEQTLPAGPVPDNGVIRLSPFISPSPSSAPSPPNVSWLFNGGPQLPQDTTMLSSGVLLLPNLITGDVRGNYTCVAERSGVTAAAIFVVHVSGKYNSSPSPIQIRETKCLFRISDYAFSK